jgi:hypothetical protein
MPTQLSSTAALVTVRLRYIHLECLLKSRIVSCDVVQQMSRAAVMHYAGAAAVPPPDLLTCTFRLQHLSIALHTLGPLDYH